LVFEFKKEILFNFHETRRSKMTAEIH